MFLDWANKLFNTYMEGGKAYTDTYIMQQVNGDLPAGVVVQKFKNGLELGAPRWWTAYRAYHLDMSNVRQR